MTLSTRRLLGLSLLAFACAISQPAHGANIYWDGSTGNWDDDWRWGSVEPTAPYNAVIGSGEVTVNLPGEEANDVHLGIGASAQLIVNSGGLLNSDNGYLGADHGGIGNATVTGAGSAWDLQGRAYIGLGGPGNGTLEIRDGASSTMYEAWISSSLEATGLVRVSGSNSSLSTSQAIHVGHSGHGTLIIEDGATVTAFRTRLAYQGIPDIPAYRSSGVLTVTGPGSTLNSQIAFAAGYKGDVTVNIENGGLITTATGAFSVLSGADASLNVTGSGSAWVSGGLLRLGDFDAAATMTTSNGGSVYVGGDGYANATDGALIISGHSGTFNGFELKSGSTLNHAGFASIGYSPGVSGRAIVRNPGTAWHNAGDFYLGDTGTGTLFIGAGAAVQVGGDLKMQTAGGTAILEFELLSETDPFIDITAGDAWLGGTLGISFATGTAPAHGNAYTLIEIAGTRHGTFDNAGQGQSVGLYNNIGMVLDYTGGDGNDLVATAIITGDADGNGTVGFADFVDLSNNYNGPATGQTWNAGDFNGDGDVAFDDFVILSNNYGFSASPAPAVVPEPTGLALLGLGGLLLTRRHRGFPVSGAGQRGELN